jgi:hypothetical protein
LEKLFKIKIYIKGEMNVKFYAIVWSKEKNKSSVLSLNETLRHRAVAEAWEIAQEKGLELESVNLVQGSRKQGEPLTKYFKERKRMRGKGKYVATYF